MDKRNSKTMARILGIGGLACAFIGSCSSAPGTLGGAQGGGVSSPIVIGGVNISGSGGSGGTSANTTAASGDANCGTSTSNMNRQPADLLLVVDRSGSMIDDIGSSNQCNTAGATCTSRWSTVSTALKTLLSQPIPGIQWGLKLFASDGY
jgi:hypothetical protein